MNEPSERADEGDGERTAGGMRRVPQSEWTRRSDGCEERVPFARGRGIIDGWSVCVSGCGWCVGATTECGARSTSTGLRGRGRARALGAWTDVQDAMSITEFE